MKPDQQDIPRPTEEERLTPWQKVGALRRDCEPHRGRLLATLARWSILAGVASLTCIFPGLAGLPLGITAWKMAKRDLVLIRRGDMDNSGLDQTEKAMTAAREGTVLSLFGLVLWSVAMGFIKTRALNP